MKIVSENIQVEKIIFSDIKDITDPITVLLDHSTRRITIYHYDGVLSGFFGNYNPEFDFESVLINLNNDQVKKSLGFESGGLREFFYLQETIHNAKNKLLSLNDCLCDDIDSLLEDIGNIEADTVAEFVTALQNVDSEGYFKDPWHEIDFVIDVPPFVKFISDKFWPVFAAYLDYRLSERRFSKRKELIADLAAKLKGKLSDPGLDCKDIAIAFINGSIDSEAVVRLSHGENMNKIHNILSDFKLEFGKYF